MATIIKRNKIYYVYYSINKKRYAKAISPIKSQAIEFKNNIELQIRARKNNLIVPKMTIKEVFNEFLENKKLKKFRTIKNLKNNYKLFQKWNNNNFKLKYIEEFNASILQKFINSRLKSNILPSTINYNITFIKSLLYYASSMNYICNINFLKNIKRVKTNKNDYIVNDDDIKKILENTSGFLKNAILISLKTGLRIGEICNLKWGNIDFDNNIIKIEPHIDWSPKTSTSKRSIPFNENFKIFLLSLKKEGENKTDFVLFNKNFKNVKEDYIATCIWRLKQKLDINKNFHFHSIRHYALTNMALSGIPIFIVSKLAGHTNSKITESIYTHISNEKYKNELKLYNDFLDKKLS